MATLSVYADAQTTATGIANQLTNPANAVGSSEATTSQTPGTTQNTDYANFFTFDEAAIAAAIPAGATINSVTMVIRDATGNTTRGTTGIRLDTANGTQFAAESTTAPPTALPAAGTGRNVTLGSTPTRTQLVDAGLGVRVRYNRTATQANTYTLDWVRLDISYVAAFTQPLSVTSTGTASVLKRAGKLASITSTGIATAFKQAGKQLAVASSGTASALKRAGKLLTISPSGTSTLQGDFVPGAVGEDTVYHVTFPTPERNPTGTQEFRARMYREGSGNPLGDMWLYQGGTAVRQLVSDQVIDTATPGEIVSGTWNASEITDKTQIEVYITGTHDGTSSARLYSVEWNATLEPTIFGQFYAALSVTASGAASVVKQIKPIRTITSTASVAVNKLTSITKSVASTGSATLQGLKIMYANLVASATGFATVRKAISTTKSINATGFATVTKFFSTTKSVTATGTASVLRQLVYLITLAANASGVTSMVRRAGKMLPVNASGIPSISKNTLKRLAISATGSATAAAGRLVTRVFTTTASGTVSARKAISTNLQTTASGIASVRKLIGKGLSTVASGIVDILGRFMPWFRPYEEIEFTFRTIPKNTASSFVLIPNDTADVSTRKKTTATVHAISKQKASFNTIDKMYAEVKTVNE